MTLRAPKPSATLLSSARKLLDCSLLKENPVSPVGQKPRPTLLQEKENEPMTIIKFPRRHVVDRPTATQSADLSALDQLTAIISADLLKRGEYPPAIVPWLLANVGIEVHQ